MIDCVSSVVLDGAGPGPVCAEGLGGGGAPRFHLVGVPAAAIRGARERVRAAIESSELTFPGRRLVVNLDESTLILRKYIMGTIVHRGQP